MINIPANRVVAIVTWLTGLASFIVGVTGTLPTSWQNTAALVGGLAVKLATALKFLEGAQHSEANAALDGRYYNTSFNPPADNSTDATA